MPTALAQLAVAALTVLWGVLSLRVARALPGDLRFRRAWWLTGVSFGALGLAHLIQSTAALLAIRAGPGHPIYEAFLLGAPVGNLARIGLAVGYAGLLSADALHPRGQAAAPGRVALVLGGAALLLGGVGLLDGPLRPSSHFPLVAIFNTVEIAALGLALVAALHGRTVDRLLWLALCTYGAQNVMSTVWFTSLAWDGLGRWTASPLHMQLMRAACYGVIVVLTTQRLRLARRGAAVSDLLQWRTAPGVRITR